MFAIGVALSTLSLLILSGSAFRDGDMLTSNAPHRRRGMRLLLKALLALLHFSFSASAEPFPTALIATSGEWQAVSSNTNGETLCAVQTHVAGGQFTLLGSSLHPGTLLVQLQKDTWQIPNLNVPIVITFDTNQVFRLTGVGEQSNIKSDVPTDKVKSFIHYFTLENDATLNLPEGREQPWHLDLKGTTPVIQAMAHCLEDAQIWLPPPFTQAPTPVTTIDPLKEQKPLGLMQTNPSTSPSKIDFIAEAVSQEKDHVESLGFEEDYLNSRIMIEDSDGSYKKFLTMRQYVSLLFASGHYESVTRISWFLNGYEGIRTKIEGKPTMNIGLRQDGNELYIDKAGGDDDIKNLDDMQAIMVGVSMVLDVAYILKEKQVDPAAQPGR